MQCPQPQLLFYGKAIPERPNIKVVGVTFSSDLTWTGHINSVVSKAKRSLFLLRRASLVLNPTALCTIYKSHVRSRMEYCCPLWFGAPASHLAKLDRIQAAAARIIGPPAKDLQSLSHRRHVAAHCVMHRLVTKRAPIALHQLIPPAAPTVRSSARLGRAGQPSFKINQLSKSNYWWDSCLPSLTRMWNMLPGAVHA